MKDRHLVHQSGFLKNSRPLLENHWICWPPYFGSTYPSRHSQVRHIAMMVIKYIPFLIFSQDMPRITDETERPRTSVKMDHTPAYMLAIVVWGPHTGNSHFFNVQKQQTGKACDFCSWQNFSAIGSLSATVTSSPTCEYHFLGPEILGPFRIHIPVPRMPMIYDSIDVRPCCWFYGC